VNVKIVIAATAVGDPYSRFHGKAIDETLNTDFWVSQTYTILRTATGTLHHEQTVDLKAGRHTVEYGVSCFVGKWVAKITANGKEIASGDITIDKHLVGSFLLGPGFLLPILIPLQIPILKARVLTFPPVLKGFLSKGKSNPGCPLNVNIKFPTGAPAAYATVDLFRVDRFLWWEHDVSIRRSMTDALGNVAFEIIPNTKYHVRATSGIKRGDFWTTPSYCNYWVYATFS